ncbi:MAG TPA: AEC family transporter [bacterium]|nr:AEC family transporter [bacterium]
MLITIVGALLPIVITLLLGFVAAWHHDFDAGQATMLNRMVMLYALPLSLFAGMVGTNRSQVLAQGPLAAAIVFGMLGTHAVVLLVNRWIVRRDLMTASLQAMAIAGPAVPFVGVTVLGYLFGGMSTIPIAIASLVMNLVQVPVSLVLLSLGATRRGGATRLKTAPRLMNHVYAALREPVVWAPVLALLFNLAGVQIPAPIRASLALLGQATGGVALFASGIVLCSRRVAVNLPVVASTLARNIIVPAVIWGSAVAVGLPSQLTREAVLTLAIPTASICVILAIQYQAAEQEMASTLFFSTILSPVTMGAFMWLMR